MTTRYSNNILTNIASFYAAESAYIKASGGDFSAVADTLAPECVVYEPASLPYGGEWRGHAGCEAWMKLFSTEWLAMDVRDTKTYPCEHIVINKSHVHAVSRVSGQNADWPLLQYLRFHRDKIVELRPFHWDTASMLPGMISTATRADAPSVA